MSMIVMYVYEMILNTLNVYVRNAMLTSQIPNQWVVMYVLVMNINEMYVYFKILNMVCVYRRNARHLYTSFTNSWPIFVCDLRIRDLTVRDICIRDALVRAVRKNDKSVSELRVSNDLERSILIGDVRERDVRERDVREREVIKSLSLCNDKVNSKVILLTLASRACWMVEICCATTDNTSTSIRLNSSKQAHAPALKTRTWLPCQWNNLDSNPSLMRNL